jgi:hypothetical protein
VKAELSRLARRARSLDPRDCHPSQVCHIIGTAVRSSTPIVVVTP